MKGTRFGTTFALFVFVCALGSAAAEIVNPGFEDDFEGWEQNPELWPEDHSAAVAGDSFTIPALQNEMAVLGTPAWGSTDLYPGRVKQSFTLDSPRFSIFVNAFSEDAEYWDLVGATLYDSGGNLIKDISLHAGDIQVLAGHGYDAYEIEASTGWTEWVFPDLEDYVGQTVSLVLTAGQTNQNDGLTPPDIALPADGDYSTWAYYDAPVNAAGTGILAGTVMDAGTGAPLEARVAAISLVTRARLLTTSDPVTGAYSFEGITAGLYRIVCLESRHRPRRKKDLVWPGETTLVDFQLRSWLPRFPMPTIDAQRR